MTNLVSIILPVFNGEKYLAQSIKSILNQSYNNFELIIVNDCSTDGSLIIINNFAKNDNRIRVINNSANEGLPNSLNIGFSAASGEYLTWTSDDNIFHNNAIYTFTNFLKLHNKIDFVYSNYAIIDNCGTILRRNCLGPITDIKYYNTIGASFLYRNSLAKKVGLYDSKMVMAEDYDYWIRCFKNGNFYKFEDILYYYRHHEQSLTSKRANLINKQTFNVLMKHFDFLLTTCKSNSEKYRFFQNLLNLADTSERYKLRLKLYNIDKSFFIHDLLSHLPFCCKRFYL